MSPKMKSPLKARPLRNPGESVGRKVLDVVFDEILLYFILALFFVIVASMEWLRWFLDAPPNPVIYTVSALVAVVLAIYKTKKANRKLKALRLGQDGEVVVGQFLDRLREVGARIFHDIPAEGFNLDHVVIHETGIYVIETKTVSKPAKGDARLIFDGESIKKYGLTPDRDPVKQVRAARRWLSELLRESTGKGFPIRAVVVYPGWYIEPTAEARSSDVWVLNPKALPSFIEHSRAQMSNEDASLCAFHLGRYIRNSRP